MIEFGKRLLVILSLPLWIVIHLIYYFIFAFILGIVGVVVSFLSYLIIGSDPFFDWWIDNFDYSFRLHENFIKKINDL